MSEQVAAGTPLAPRLGDVQSRVILAGAVGNLVEWYDWTVYGLLVGVFSPAIFPRGNPLGSVIAALLTFAVGFLMRPIGSLVLSPFADRLGRRQVLSVSILIMGAGSLIVALTPPYARIGIAAPLLILLARLMQGFSTGAEFQSSTVYLVEHAPAARRGLAGSVQLSSIGVAILFATGVAALTTNLIPQPALGAWGWRIPFLIGGLLSAYGLWIRLRLPETPHFTALEQHGQTAERPLLETLREHRAAALYVFCVQIGTVMFYTWTVFLPTYAHLAGGLPLAQGLTGGLVALAAFVIAVPASAALSDRVGRKPLLVASAAGFVLLTWPMLSALRDGDFTTFLIVGVVGCVLVAMTDGVMAALFCELFPTRVRTSGIGVPYQVASAIFGGTAPLIAAWFIRVGHPMGMAVYIMALALVCGTVFLTMPETRGRPLH